MTRLLLIAALLLGVAGCAPGVAEPAVAASPGRATSSDQERFLERLEDDSDLDRVSRAELAAAGRLACAAMDRDAPVGDVLMAVVGAAHRAETMTAVTSIATVASETLCSEHAGYLG